LAIPDAEHAVVARAGIEVDLLGAPQRGGGEVLVGAGLELDVVLLDEALGLPQRLVEAAQRRAAIARDVARGIEVGGKVALALHHRQPHQRLRSGQIDPPAFQQVFVVESHCQRHDTPSGIVRFTVATESCCLQSGTGPGCKKTFSAAAGGGAVAGVFTPPPTEKCCKHPLSLGDDDTCRCSSSRTFAVPSTASTCCAASTSRSRRAVSPA